MIIKKNIEVSLDIYQPDDIYNQDTEKTILKLLNNKFKTKCYKSCLILNINNIIKRSMINMTDDLDGSATVDVIFESDVIEYIPNEIINGCEILKVENGYIHAKSKYASIQINMKKNISIYTEGDIVPVIVRKSAYNINKDSISVAAAPFMPIREDIQYFKIINNLDIIERKYLTSLLNQLKKYEEKINKIDKNVLKFFNELLSFNVKIKSSKKINIYELTEKDMLNNIVFTHQGNYKSTEVQLADEKKIKEYKEENAFIALSTIIIKHLNNLQTLISFSEHYPTFADVSKNKSLWGLYMKQKK